MDRRQKEKIMVFLAGAIGVILIAISLTLFIKNRVPKGWAEYRNKEYGFVIHYPKDWTYEENKNGGVVVFLSPLENKDDPWQENVGVVVQDLSSKPMNLSEYTLTAIHQAQVVLENKIEIVENQETTLAKKRAHLFGFKGTYKMGDLQYLMTWTIKDDRAFQVSYSSFTKSYFQYLDVAEKMFKSFRFL